MNARSALPIRLAAAVLLAVLAGAAGSTLHAQSFCTVPGPPAAPPPPPPPPPYCTPNSCNTCTTSPCYAESGGYTNDFADLMVNTASFPITVARHYESLRYVDGPLGVGWTSSLTPRLYYAVYLFAAPSTYSHEVDVLMPDGSLLPFNESGNTYTQRHFRSDSLVHNGDGTWDLRPQDRAVTLHFRADGALDRDVDAAGNALTFSYDGNGRLVSAQDAAGSGRSVSVTWGGNGRIATITDSANRSVSYGYDASGALTSVTNPLGQVTSMTYQSGRFAPLLTSIRDHWNRSITELTYQSDDRLHSYTEGDFSTPTSTGEKYTYTYNNPYLITKTDSLSSHSYNVDAATWIVSNGTSRDLAGRPTLVNEGTGTASYWYDSQGRVDLMYKDSVYWKFTYDANYPTQIASYGAFLDYAATTPTRNYAALYFTYVAPGNPGAGRMQNVQQMRSDGSARDTLLQYTYDSGGRVTGSTDEDGVVSSFAYNAAGDLTSMTRGGFTTQYAYDSLGRVTSMTNPLGKVTTYTYDNADRLLTITLPKPSPSSPLTFTTTYSYDSYDATTGLTFNTTTDPNGRTFKSGFDALGNLVREVDALNNTTQYLYRYNLLWSIVDANNNVTSYTYDNSTRTHVGTTYPNGGTESFSLASNGSLVSKTDRRGITANYSYDVWGRPLTISWTQNGVTIESATNTYSGQKLTSTTYTKGTTSDTVSYTYDTSYRVQTETQGSRAKITYGYYFGSAGSRIYTYSIDPVSGSGTNTNATYGYDAAGRVTSINWSRAGIFSLAYNAIDQITAITYPNGAQRLYTYDDQGRTTQVANTHPSASATIFSYAYDHDWATNTDTARGQLTSVDVSAVPAAGQRVGTTKYTYDAKYQLVRVDYAASYSEQFTYDAIGNRIAAAIPYPITYTYDQNNAGHNTPLLRYDGTSAGNYSYDANGNLLGLASSPAAQWDAQNRLLAVGGGSYTYAYDFMGRRITGKTSTNTTTYVYHGLQPVSERNSSPASQTDYLFGPGLDLPLAMSPSPGVEWVLQVDGQGSIVGAVQDDGTMNYATWYTAFGQNSSATGLFGYTGREWSGTGYVYYRSRHYDPQRGRFTSEDPIRDVADVIGGEMYGYASNSPIMNVDPMGLQSCTWRIIHGIWQKTSTDWTQEWRIDGSKFQQSPTLSPPGTRGLLGGKWPIWVKFVMTCWWRRWLIVTDHWTRKNRLTVYCDCPQNATNAFYDETKSDSFQYFQGGAITTSSWMMGMPMKPCPPPH